VATKNLGFNIFTNGISKKFIGFALWLILLTFIFSIPYLAFTQSKKLNVSFLDQNGNKNALVFFGFRGCSNVCPMTLLILSQLLKSQKNAAQWPQIVFVDIDVSSDSIQASTFAKKFHPSFVGLHIPPEELPTISAKFGLNIKGQSNEILHFGKTYLLQKKEKDWRLVKTYIPNAFSVKTLQKDLFDYSY